MSKNIAIIGCQGAIGQAFLRLFRSVYPEAYIHGFSRSTPAHPLQGVDYHVMDYLEEVSIKQSATLASQESGLDIVIVTNGILHEGSMMPEKSLRDISRENLLRLFEVNTIVPSLVTKHFIPKLKRRSPSIFATLSARVGSISDNRLGGWYGYRASKAALNMIIKNAALETARKNRQAVVVGLHPGTVDSALSEPFQSHVPPAKLFTPDDSVRKLWEVLQSLKPSDSGSCLAWDGKKIEP